MGRGGVAWRGAGRGGGGLFQGCAASRWAVMARCSRSEKNRIGCACVRVLRLTTFLQRFWFAHDSNVADRHFSSSFFSLLGRGSLRSSVSLSVYHFVQFFYVKFKFDGIFGKKTGIFFLYERIIIVNYFCANLLCKGDCYCVYMIR